MFGAALAILSEKIPCLRKRFSRKVQDGLDDGLFENPHEIKHVRMKAGDKFFSIIAGEVIMPEIPLGNQESNFLNMNMKEIFMLKTIRDSEQRKRYPLKNEDDIHLLDSDMNLTEHNKEVSQEIIRASSLK